jgi:hypothetical protein
MARISEISVKEAFEDRNMHFSDADAVSRALLAVQQSGVGLEEFVNQYDTVTLTR